MAGNENIDISPDIPTYPQILHAAGYETAYVGKWHMDARTDMPRLLAAFDIFIHPSTDEPLALAVLEAAAAGLPMTRW